MCALGADQSPATTAGISYQEPGMPSLEKKARTFRQTFTVPERTRKTRTPFKGGPVFDLLCVIDEAASRPRHSSQAGIDAPVGRHEGEFANTKTDHATLARCMLVLFRSGQRVQPGDMWQIAFYCLLSDTVSVPSVVVRPLTPALAVVIWFGSARSRSCHCKCHQPLLTWRYENCPPPFIGWRVIWLDYVSHMMFMSIADWTAVQEEVIDVSAFTACIEKRYVRHRTTLLLVTACGRGRSLDFGLQSPTEFTKTKKRNKDKRLSDRPPLPSVRPLQTMFSFLPAASVGAAALQFLPRTRLFPSPLTDRSNYGEFTGTDRLSTSTNTDYIRRENMDVVDESIGGWYAVITIITNEGVRLLHAKFAGREIVIRSVALNNGVSLPAHQISYDNPCAFRQSVIVSVDVEANVDAYSVE
ncbi:unnamed protein product [Soboliphyme baturini]|uniref:Agenet domain-containing protein n=1 Tax=Soboliphyme baturini TaxID=241478 RepID=A0A183IAZ4_9BILA|nr:unnamed protein product [Soboliphyme baturini]